MSFSERLDAEATRPRSNSLLRAVKAIASPRSNSTSQHHHHQQQAAVAVAATHSSDMANATTSTSVTSPLTSPRLEVGDNAAQAMDMASQIAREAAARSQSHSRKNRERTNSLAAAAASIKAAAAAAVASTTASKTGGSSSAVAQPSPPPAPSDSNDKSNGHSSSSSSSSSNIEIGSMWWLHDAEAIMSTPPSQQPQQKWIPVRVVNVDRNGLTVLTPSGVRQQVPMAQVHRGATVDTGEADQSTSTSTKKSTPTNAAGAAMARTLMCMNSPTQDGIDNMIDLQHHNEPCVMHNLAARFNKDRIYTNTGDILVALNPYKALGGNYYGMAAIERVRSQPIASLSPHIYVVARRAMDNLMANNTASQSILVSGESGAGKTETTKFLLEYFAFHNNNNHSVPSARPTAVLAAAASASASATSSSSAIAAALRPIPLLRTSTNGRLPRVAETNSSSSSSSGRVTGLADPHTMVLRANPLLEAFGNSKTRFNDNSSRFGKFIRLQFAQRDYTVVGAIIQTYLPEKIRVARAPSRERSYHIFYQLLAIANNDSDERGQAERRGLHSKDPRDYAYLAQTGCYVIDRVDDARQFDETWQAMVALGFNDEERACCFDVVAAILHLGNVEFAHATSAEQQQQQEGALTIPIGTPQTAFAYVAELLGLDYDALAASMTRRMVSVPCQSSIAKALTVEQAQNARDSLAMLLYGQLFEWLVRRINQALQAPADTPLLPGFIGVLDIFGFECFEGANGNGFEQLCINYANEKLQQLFNEYTFQMEQREYVAEGIEWKSLSYRDNSSTIEMIEHGPQSIVAMLNDECRMPGGKDASLREKLRNIKRLGGANQPEHFSVTHYAGKVNYWIRGFVERNQDFTIAEHVELLQGASRNAATSAVLSAIFSKTAAASSSSSSSSTLAQGLGKSTSREDPAASSPSSSSRRRGASFLNGPVGGEGFRDETLRPRGRTNAGGNSGSNTPTIGRRGGANTGSQILDSSGSGSGSGNTFQFVSVMGQFRDSLQVLMVTIRQTTPHFVRCIKPNDAKQAGIIDDVRVCEQLRYSGLVEALRIVQAGWPNRISYLEFLRRFGAALAPPRLFDKRHALSAGVDVQRDLSLTIMERIGWTAKQDYCGGRSKMFFRSGQLTRLDELRRQVIARKAVVIQKHWRRVQCRRRYLEQRRRIVELQAAVRGFLQRQMMRRRCALAAAVQSAMRGWLARCSLRGAIEKRRHATIHELIGAAAIGKAVRAFRLPKLRDEHKQRQEHAERERRVRLEALEKERQLQATNERLNAERQLITLKTIEIEELKAANADLEQRLKANDDACKQHTHELASITRQRDALLVQSRDHVQKLDAAKAALQNAKQLKQSKEADIAALQAQLAQLSESQSKDATARAQDSQAALEWRRRAEQAEAKTQENDELLSSMRRQLDELRQQADGARADANAKSVEIDLLAQRAREMEQRRTETTLAHETQLSEARSNADRLRQELDSAQQQLCEANEQRAQALLDVKQLGVELESVRQTLSTFKSTSDDAQARSVESAVEAVRRQAAESDATLRQHLAIVERERDEQRALAASRLADLRTAQTELSTAQEALELAKEEMAIEKEEAALLRQQKDMSEEEAKRWHAEVDNARQRHTVELDEMRQHYRSIAESHRVLAEANVNSSASAEALALCDELQSQQQVLIQHLARLCAVHEVLMQRSRAATVALLANNNNSNNNEDRLGRDGNGAIGSSDHLAANRSPRPSRRVTGASVSFDTTPSAAAAAAAASSSPLSTTTPPPPSILVSPRARSYSSSSSLSPSTVATVGAAVSPELDEAEMRRRVAEVVGQMRGMPAHDLTRRVVTLEQDMIRLQTERSQLEAELVSVKNELEHAGGVALHCQLNHGALQEELTKARAELNELRVEHRDLAAVLGTSKALREAVLAEKRKYKELKGALQERNRLIDAHEATIRQQTEKLGEYLRENPQPILREMWNQEREALNAEVKRLHDTVQKLRRDNFELSTSATSAAAAAASASAALSPRGGNGGGGGGGGGNRPMSMTISPGDAKATNPVVAALASPTANRRRAGSHSRQASSAKNFNAKEAAAVADSTSPRQQQGTTPTEMAALRAQLDVLKERLAVVDADAKSAREQLAQANTHVEDLRTSNTQLRDSMAQLQERARVEHEKQVDALRAEIDRLKKLVSEMEEECISTQNELDGQVEYTRLSDEEKQRMGEDIATLRCKLQGAINERDRLRVLVDRVFEVEYNIDAFIRFSSMATVAAASSTSASTAMAMATVAAASSSSTASASASSAAPALTLQQQQQCLVTAFKQLVSVALMRDGEFLALPSTAVMPPPSSARAAGANGSSTNNNNNNNNISRHASSSSVSTMGSPLSAAVSSTSVSRPTPSTTNGSSVGSSGNEERYPSGGVLLSRFITYYSDDNVELFVRLAQQQATTMLDDSVKLPLRQRCYAIECLTFADLLMRAEHGFYTSIRRADRATFYNRLTAELDTTITQLLNTLCRAVYRDELQLRAVDTLAGKVDMFGSANKSIGVPDPADDEFGLGAAGMMLPVRCDALLEQLRSLNERLLAYSMPLFLVAQIMVQISKHIDCGCFNAFLLRPQGYSFERGMHLMMNIGPVEEYLFTLIEPMLSGGSSNNDDSSVRPARVASSSPSRDQGSSLHRPASVSASAPAGRRLLPHCTDLARLLMCDKHQVVANNNYRDICPSLTPAQIYHVLCNYSISIEMQEQIIDSDDLQNLAQTIQASTSSTSLSNSLAASRVNSGSRLGGRPPPLQLSRLRTALASPSKSAKDKKKKTKKHSRSKSGRRRHRDASSSSSSSSASSSSSSSSSSEDDSDNDDDDVVMSSDDDDGPCLSDEEVATSASRKAQQQQQQRHGSKKEKQRQMLQRYKSSDDVAAVLSATDIAASATAEAAAALFEEQGSTKMFPINDYRFSLSRAYVIDLEAFRTFIAPLEWLNWYKSSIVENLAAATNSQAALPQTRGQRAHTLNGFSPTSTLRTAVDAAVSAAASASSSASMVITTASPRDRLASAVPQEPSAGVSYYVAQLAAQRRNLEDHQKTSGTQYGVH